MNELTTRPVNTLRASFIILCNAQRQFAAEKHEWFRRKSEGVTANAVFASVLEVMKNS